MTLKTSLVSILLVLAGFHAEAKHVIVISCDGLRPDAIKQLGKDELPNLHRLIEEGAYTDNARTDVDFTVTLPNHTSMITGRGVKGDSGHNWTANGTPKLGEFLHKNKKAYLRSMFGVAHDNGLSTALFSSKKKFVLYDLSYDERFGQPDSVGEDNGKDKIDHYEFNEDTAMLVAAFLVKMSRDPYDLSFLHLRDPDSAGHGNGWDLKLGSPYLRAVARCDMLIGQILVMIDSDERLRDQTHLIVTADHGGRLQTKTHTDSKQRLNYTIPFFVWGPGVAAGTDLHRINPDTRHDPGQVNPPYTSEGLPPVRNGDAGNLALRLLGLPAIEGSTINAAQDLRIAMPPDSDVANATRQEPETKPESKERRPNILWIVGENLKLDLGCYGAKNVRTPNLDGLAADGIRYTHAFSTSPVCAPSRSAFFVGMYQTTTDTHNMRSHRDDGYRLPEGVRPITHRLRDAGYFSANIKTIGDEVVGSGKLDLNFVKEGKLYDTDKWEPLKDNQPFFAQINTLEAEYDIYDRQTWKQPRVEWKGEQHHEKIATPENVTPPPYYPDHPIVREEWARYLNSISGMDKTVGRILAQLKADGLADNTVVVFFGDNGRIEPRGIHWCYDTGLHVPMIVHWPKGIPRPQNYKPGDVRDEVVSLIDLTPTTLGIAGIERPHGMHGRVFLGDRVGPEREFAFSARDRIDETVNRIRSVRGKRYHYLRNYFPDRHFTSLNRYKEKCFPIKPLMRRLMKEGKLTGAPAALMSPTVAPEQLFDTVNDPHEIHNLADSKEPEHVEVLNRMRAALAAWIVETQDQGEFPEPPEVVAPFEKEMHDWFGTPEWYGKDD